VRLIRHRARRVALVVAAAAALAGGLGALGPHAWWLELFAHFRPQYAVLLAASGIALVALGAPASGLAAAALAVVNALPLLHYYAPPPQPQAEVHGPELRAVLINVYFRNAAHERLLDYLHAVQPDVAVFLEATPAWRKSLRRLAAVLPHQAESGELFVASRWPLTVLRAEPFGGDDAGAMVFTLDAGGRPFTVVGAHASWPLGRAFSARRNEQLVELARLVRAAPAPVLLLADLNLTAFTPRFTQFLADAGLADCSAGRGWQPGWPALFPPLALRIDHCLHGAGVEPRRVATGPFIGSDHYPLEVTLRFRDAALPPTSPR
jgi:endonuclease/exonuclease/phosphatase (EEP) superfamily protein YafD